MAIVANCIESLKFINVMGENLKPNSCQVFHSLIIKASFECRQDISAAPLLVFSRSYSIGLKSKLDSLLYSQNISQN